MNGRVPFPPNRSGEEQTGKNIHRQVLRFSQPLQKVRMAPPRDPRREAEIEEMLRAKYEQGLRDGEKGLREQLLQQRADIVELQKGVLQSLERALPQVRTECEAALVELALEVAKRVILNFPVEAVMVEAAIREALDSLEDAHQVRVLVNELDMQLLVRMKSPILGETNNGEKVAFEVSSEVSRGGCMVHTRFGVVDARRESKFEQVQNSLRG